MLEAGILDPAKVVRRAIIDSSSVASLMITTECMIVDAKEDKPAGNPMAGMGGMGGMGGMMWVTIVISEFPNKSQIKTNNLIKCPIIIISTTIKLNF